jgi:hypothetical protein
MVHLCPAAVRAANFGLRRTTDRVVKSPGCTRIGYYWQANAHGQRGRALRLPCSCWPLKPCVARWTRR